MSKKKSGLKKVNVNGIEWNYVVEADMDRRSEVRVYEPGTKQIKKRISFTELGFDAYQIEHMGCKITPAMVKEYIEKEFL
jgi:hypothetical protein